MTAIHIRKQENTQKRKEGNVKMEAETTVMCLQAKEHQGLLANTWSEEKGMEIFSLPPWGTNSVHTSILDFWPLELWENKFLLF